MRRIILWADTPDRRGLLKKTGMLPEVIPDESGEVVAAISEAADVEGVLYAKEIEAGVLEIDYLLVDPSCRRRGAGRAMVEAVAAATPHRPLGADLLVASYIERETEDEALGLFFDSLGFEGDDSPSSIYHYRLDDFSPFMEGRTKTFTGKIRPLSNLTKGEYQKLLSLLKERREQAGMDEERDAGMVWILPESMEAYEADLSMILLNEEEDPCGCLLVSENNSSLIIEYLCVVRDGGNSTGKLMKLVNAAFTAAREKYSRDTAVVINALNPSMAEFIEKITHAEAASKESCVLRVRYGN